MTAHDSQSTFFVPSPPPPDAPLIEHALHLASAGFPVIFTHSPTPNGCSCGRPDCQAIGKHPVEKRWQKSGTSDAVIIRDRLSRLQFTPNVSIVLGPMGDFYVVAVDVDSESRMAELLEELGPLPTTVRIDSARGYRLLFTLPPSTPLDRVSNVTGVLKKPGVDIKAAGGQIVMPPSMHASGVRYTWHATGQVAELSPAWVIAILKPPPKPPEAAEYTPQTLREDRRAQARFEKYLQAATMRQAAIVAQCGQGLRNTTLYLSLCSILPLAHGLSLVGGHQYVLRELSKAALACGLPQSEVSRTIASAERWMRESGAVRVPHEVFVNGSQPAPAGESSFKTSSSNEIELVQDNNSPAKISENVARLIAKHPAWLGGARWSEYSGLYLWPQPLPEPISAIHRFERETVKSDYSAIQAWCLGQGLKVGLETVEIGVKLAADRNPTDELKDWVQALPRWDGLSRLSRWLCTYLGCEDTPYHHATGSSWLRAALQRALEPGLPVDIVPVLQGEQGSYKNRALEVLFAGGHRSAPWLSLLGTWDPDKADTKRMACQRWILHDDEFSARKPRIVDAMKSWVSRTTEQWQAKYENDITTSPRRALLVCSTNVEHYLHDRTGNRRWFPWRIGVTHPIRHEALAADRLQLFSEAMRGPAWREGLEGVAEAHLEATEEALATDAIEDQLASLIMKGDWSGWTQAIRLNELLGVPPERQTIDWMSSLGSAIKRMGGGSRRVRISGSNNKIREFLPPKYP